MTTLIDYFDHDADIGIIGRGNSLEAAFCSAASAVFKIMTDTSLVIPKQRVEIKFTEEDPELALVVWINCLLGKARELNLIFCEFELMRSNTDWLGCAYGDKWQNKFTRGTEVKGATLTMLKVMKLDYWQVQCVVDV